MQDRTDLVVTPLGDSAEPPLAGEKADRPNLSLVDGYDELITAVAPRTIVVLTVPEAVEMPWLDQVNAVLVPFYAGQGTGDAVASLLMGEHSPSGKLTTTFPRRVQDLPPFFGYQPAYVVSVKVETSSISVATFCSIGLATGSPRLARPREMRERQRSSTHSRRSG